LGLLKFDDEVVRSRNGAKGEQTDYQLAIRNIYTRSNGSAKPCDRDRPRLPLLKKLCPSTSSLIVRADLPAVNLGTFPQKDFCQGLRWLEESPGKRHNLVGAGLTILCPRNLASLVRQGSRRFISNG